MDNIARILMIVYGVLMLGGGVGGYAKAGSKPSLIAGITSAILMGVAYFVSRQQPRVGFGIGALVAAGLVVVFLRRIQEQMAKGDSAGMSIGLCAFSGLVALTFVIAAVRARA